VIGSNTPQNPPPPKTPRPPSRPPSKPPNKVYADTLADIDAMIIAAMAVAYFGPAEQCTSSSVRQTCAAEVLLFRLRSARRAVRDLADAYGIQSPARQSEPVAAVGTIATPGEPDTFTTPQPLGPPRFRVGRVERVGA
jgi:hypothetical protein